MKKRIAFLLLILLLSSNLIFDTVSSYYNIKSSLSTSEEVRIYSDNDFEKYALGGDGSLHNPYVIQYRSINSEYYVYTDGILITNTSKYCIIKNCEIKAYHIGINVMNVTPNTLTCMNIIVENSEIGIKVFNCQNMTIRNNRLSTREIGIWLNRAAYSTVLDNTLGGGGIMIQEELLEYYTSYEIQNNFVNQKPLGVFINQQNFDLRDPIYGQLVLVNCINSIVGNQQIFKIEQAIALIFCTNITIRDCTCSGIYLNYSKRCVVESNNCHNAPNYRHGIHLENSDNCTIRNNICYENRRGISVEYCPFSNIGNNTCENNERAAIYLAYSTQSIISNNTCYGEYGINIKSSTSSSILDNICSTKRDAIYSINSPQTLIKRNNCTNSGLEIYGSSMDEYLDYVVENNLVNKKELGFIYNTQFFDISSNDYGQIVLLNCSHGIIRNQTPKAIDIPLRLNLCTNVSIRNNNLSLATEVGIFIANCSILTVEENICNNALRGIYIFFSKDLFISNNVFCYNKHLAIDLYWVNASIFTKNYCYKSYHTGFTFSNLNYSVISENKFLQSEFDGIRLRRSNLNVLENNTFSKCGSAAIRLSWSDSLIITRNNFFSDNVSYLALELYGVNYCNITNNLINNTDGNGISVSIGKNISINHNTIQNSARYGVFLGQAVSNCSVHHNSFIDNSGSFQAFDDGSDNIWYYPDTEEGNYWSDWTGIGSYQIGGTAQSLDEFPLQEIPESEITNDLGDTARKETKNLFAWIIMMSLIVIISIQYFRLKKKE